MRDGRAGPTAVPAPDTSPRTGLDMAPHMGHRWGRTLVFVGIYLYQGVVAGFSLTALANHLAGLGLPAREVGLHFALAGLPWTVQPLLWGPLIDRAGRSGRRAWAVRALLGAQASLCALWLVQGPTALGLIGLVFLLHSACAALLDTACDRMIMDHVPVAELGLTSGCTRGGLVLGTSLGAATFSWTLTAWTFPANVGLLVGAGVLALLPLLLVREGPRLPPAAAPRAPARSFLRGLCLSLRRPEALRLLALCLLLDLAQALFQVRFAVEVVQVHGWDAASLSRLQAGLALGSGTLGALGIGLWSDRAGPLPALSGLLAAGAAAFALAGGLIATGLAGTAAPVILALTDVLPNLLVVALVPALMRASRGRGAATRFEVFMAAMNLGSVVGAGLSGFGARLLPSGAVAGLAAAVFLGAWAASRRPHLLFPRGLSPRVPR